MKLEGRVSIVTGGGRGIGQGIVHCLAEEGSDIAVVDVDGNNARKVAEEVKALGRRSLAVRADATKWDDVQRAVQEALASFGKIDILVNNVGRGALDDGFRTRVSELEERDWDVAYEVNLKSHFLFCKAVVPHMVERKQGKIVNIASIAGKLGANFIIPYSSMKGGVISFTKALARELARSNINVNCICPGLLYTAMWEQLGSLLAAKYRTFSGKTPREVYDQFVKEQTPLGRGQTPEDIGRAVVFLVSDDARNITGQSLNVDGGEVMD